MERRFELIFYTDNGKNYIKKFLDDVYSKDKKMFSAIQKGLDTLEDRGVEAGMPLVKKLKPSNVWELRPHAHIRILFKILSQGKIILLNAFRKNQRETPPGEIERAERRYQNYINNQ